MPLNLAVIGAGSMGRQHARHIEANPRCRLAAVVEPSPWNGPVPSYESIAALLAVIRPDGAIVATPNHLHADHTIALIDAGVPVLVEKPIADTVPAGAAIVRRVRETGVPVLVGHHRRHSAAIRAAQHAIAGGRLGRIAAVHATTLFHKPADYFNAEWRRGSSGGPILINLVHDIDSLRALVGEITAVQAAASRAIRGFEAEDTAAVILEFAGGALGTLLLSDTAVSMASWEHTSGENPSYPRDIALDCILISGTQGSLGVPGMRLWHQTGAPSWTARVHKEKLELETADPIARQLDHFCDVIERHAQPLVAADDALRSLAVTLAVREAAQTGTRIVPKVD
jgi:predicted dehydrogenase